MGKRRNQAIAAVAAMSLALGTAATVLPAAAGETVYQPVGQVVMRTGAVDEVTYDGQTQSLTTAGTCDLASSGADLLRFSGTLADSSRKVGLRADSIGVIESSLTSLCNKVDVVSFKGSETLKLQLGAGLTNFAKQPLLATKATLDLEVFSAFGSKAKIKATATLAGAPVGAYELSQGSTACNVADGGNCSWVIEPGVGKRFDTLMLSAVKGSFSLEGGSDTGSSVTAFDLVSPVDAVLNCEEGNNTLTEGRATVTYIGNASGAACEGFGVTLTAENDFVQFLKPLDVATDAQFFVDIDWVLPAPASPAVALPSVFIDFEVPGGAGERELPFCLGVLYDGGVLTGIREPGAIEALPDWEPALAGKQYACIGQRSADVTPTSYVVTDRIFLYGDARMRRS